jgi:hypothetical protein
MRDDRYSNERLGSSQLERELVDLFLSLGRNSVLDVSGEPHIRFVRSFEPADDDHNTIYTSGINRLSLTFVARLLANKFRGTL